MRKDVLKQACIYRKCVYLRKPVPRFRQDAPTPNNDASSPTNGVSGGPINKPSATPPRKPNSNNNNTTTTNNNINSVAASTPALSNCSSNSNSSSHNNSTANGSNNNNSTSNHMGGGASNGGTSSTSSSSSHTTNSGISSVPGLHHSATSGTTELSSCRLNQSPFGANPPGANGVILDPLRHRTMMDAHYQHHRAPGGPPFFDPMAAQLPATGSPHHHHQHDLTPAAAAAAAVAAAAAAGNSMSPHHPVPHLNAHSQATKMVSPSSSSAATSREAAAAATTYFPHPAESWGSAVPYAAFPRAPSWAASAYGFQQHSSPFASSFTPSSFPPSPFPGSSCRLSLPDSGSSSSASRYGPTAATTAQHPFHHSMTGISGFSTGDALSHAQYSHHPAHAHAHSNMRSSFYPPAPPTGHHLGSSSTLSSFPGLAPPSFGHSPYHPHPHSHMYPGSFYSSLRAATEPQIYHVQVLPSQNPFKLLLQETCDFLDSFSSEKTEMKPFHKDFSPHFSDIWDRINTKSVPQIGNSPNDDIDSLKTDTEQALDQQAPETCSPLNLQDPEITKKDRQSCLHQNHELTASDDETGNNELDSHCPLSLNIPFASRDEKIDKLSQKDPQPECLLCLENSECCVESTVVLEIKKCCVKGEQENCGSESENNQVGYVDKTNGSLEHDTPDNIPHTGQSCDGTGSRVDDLGGMTNVGCEKGFTSGSVTGTKSTRKPFASDKEDRGSGITCEISGMDRETSSTLSVQIESAPYSSSSLLVSSISSSASHPSSPPSSLSSSSSIQQFSPNSRQQITLETSSHSPTASSSYQ
ncbi:hypothetical protein ElyMa_002464500 [Elysia marginata]|uniref:Uncharacterized protein n=1 Tax=Elysia marginata TaxID=1093978 RepID=A0AAV4GKR9_9GAST|nr:hypothetical protein ElyMa_002464500 [Elysia marginata]